MSKIYLDKIEALRGIAILLVLGFHTCLTISPNFEATEYAANGVLAITSVKSFILNFNPVGQGWIGVELFLVISGFLIHFIYLQNPARFTWSNFFSKRFWRIYPPYLFVLVFFFVSQNVFSKESIVGLTTHALLIHNLNNTTFFQISPSFWSIALEAQLYLIYPIYLFLVRTVGIIKATLVVSLLAFVFSAIAYVNDVDSVSFLTFVFKFWFIWCLGALLADRYHLKKRMFRYPLIWVFFSYSMVVIFKLFYPISFFIQFPATLFCLSLIELFLYSDLLHKYLGNHQIPGRILSLIGLISYSIYLIHQPYLGNLINFFSLHTRFNYLNTFIGVAFSYGVILLLSYSLYKTLELKSIRIGQRRRQ